MDTTFTFFFLFNAKSKLQHTATGKMQIAKNFISNFAISNCSKTRKYFFHLATFHLKNFSSSPLYDEYFDINVLVYYLARSKNLSQIVEILTIMPNLTTPVLFVY